MTIRNLAKKYIDEQFLAVLSQHIDQGRHPHPDRQPAPAAESSVCLKKEK
jgi:hypothetical protein